MNIRIRKFKKLYVLLLFFLASSLVMMRFTAENIQGTKSQFISVANTDESGQNGLIDVNYQLFDLDGNPIQDVDTDVPFILKVTNTGTLPIDYKINTDGTEHNDFSNYLLLNIDNLYTSDTSDSDFFYVSKDFLFPRKNTFEYVIRNNRLNRGQTDTWRILYSSELTKDPTFQKNVTITSTSADMKLNIIINQTMN